MSTYYNGKLFPKPPKYDKWEMLKEWLQKEMKAAGKGTVTARNFGLVLKKMPIIKGNAEYYNQREEGKQK